MGRHAVSSSMHHSVSSTGSANGRAMDSVPSALNSHLYLDVPLVDCAASCG